MLASNRLMPRIDDGAQLRRDDVETDRSGWDLDDRLRLEPCAGFEDEDASLIAAVEDIAAVRVPADLERLGVDRVRGLRDCPDEPIVVSIVVACGRRRQSCLGHETMAPGSVSHEEDQPAERHVEQLAVGVEEPWVDRALVRGAAELAKPGVMAHSYRHGALPSTRPMRAPTTMHADMTVA
ncbi:MAG: hypothetical protein R3A51_23400, partial [Nannocystaceae bacterium]